MNLSFAELRTANVTRCESAYHAVADWSPTDWACALAGEAGEACNEVKKLRRIAETPEALADGTNAESRVRDMRTYHQHVDAVADELADIIIYADLLAERLDIDLGEAVRAKFNRTSDKVGSTIKLLADGDPRSE